ncbi:hypothetical protein DID88_005218 [Monilinia fructigena]|uniref:THIF-type NAD/FAD binding fold domain-containing protein n=1 Tax=Monilinia fructigena TaxID=38457 RepID=A0A395IDS0_9HELO|nr:hypothetical protein DID88_005218 [Monilinia fructigena]
MCRRTYCKFQWQIEIALAAYGETVKSLPEFHRLADYIKLNHSQDCTQDTDVASIEEGPWGGELEELITSFSTIEELYIALYTRGDNNKLKMALKFAPFASEIELPFYTALSQLKIDHDKLDDSARPVLGLYEPRSTQSPDQSSRMMVLGNALSSNEVPLGHIRAEGKIKNVNTIEDFKNMDKQAMFTNFCQTVTGWERNSLGKLTAKVTNLAQYMDPAQLADQAVDLNLKLMKLLMGVGVRKITFIDNASVSFSNPVRQPLFDFKDCIDGGVPKAYRAAEALQEIYPGVDSTGHVMAVPMLGHPITDEAATKMNFEVLQKLIENHDAIFLLMDTRESRWLPTVMGKAAGKIVMNAALGFDTYVVAPSDSVKDQTLDQQCTVTRPGVAPEASSKLVELLASILQHPAARCCTSSETLRKPAIRSIGIRSRPAKSPSRSQLSGLAEVQRKAEAAANDVEWDSDEEGIEDGDGELL